jgi:hypothetical protein
MKAVREHVFRQTNTVLTALMLVFVNCCIIVPTPSHGGTGVITEETVVSLRPETSTRADVLHLLGDPAYTEKDHRFFVYWWEETNAYIIPLGGPAFGPSPVTKSRHLVFEFSPDNHLKRLEFIDSPEILNETLDRWTKENEFGIRTLDKPRIE